MRLGYFNGAPGVFTSAAAWLAAAIVALRVSPQQAVWVLFVGGALIHPVSVLLTKALGRSGKHQPGNPMATLAFASTAWLIFMLPLAYGVALLRIEWFFPAMLLVIGGRYLVFATMFGRRIYWACGLTLAGAGYLLAKMGAAPAVSAFAGSFIEAAFAAAIIVLARRELRPSGQAHA